MSSATALTEALSDTLPNVDSAAQKIDASSFLVKQASIENLDALNDRRRLTVPPPMQTERTSAIGLHPNYRVASFAALQEWDGYVTSVGSTSFFARITDVTSKGTTDAEEVEMPLGDLSDSDRSRLKAGSLFRWSIGTERLVDGQKRRISQFILRQLPRWRSGQIERARSEANEIVDSINWK
jgi:hypothetical protein